MAIIDKKFDTYCRDNDIIDRKTYKQRMIRLEQIKLDVRISKEDNRDADVKWYLD